MGFPYLKLPDLPQELIIQQLDVTDIITLSLASKKSKTAVKRARIFVKLSWKIKHDNRTRIKIKTLSTGKRLRLSIEPCQTDNWNKLLGQYLMLSQPNGPLSPLYVPEENQKTLYPFKFLDDIKTFIQCSDAQILVALKPGNDRRSLKVTDILSNHLLDIFQVTEPFSYSSVNPAIPSFYRRCLGRIRKFSLRADMSPEEATFYLDQLSVDNFELKTDGFKYDKPIHHKKVMLYGGKWLSLDNLIDMKCTTLYAGDVHLTNQDLITFVNHWINGGCPQLESLELSSPNSALNSSILDHFGTTPSRRHPEDGRDVRRASDGALATLIGTEHHSTLFEFRFNVSKSSDN